MQNKSDRLAKQPVIMIGDRHRYIEDRESASRQQRAKGTIGILQTPSHE